MTKLWRISANPRSFIRLWMAAFAVSKSRAFLSARCGRPATAPGIAAAGAGGEFGDDLNDLWSMEDDDDDDDHVDDILKVKVSPTDSESTMPKREASLVDTDAITAPVDRKGFYFENENHHLISTSFADSVPTVKALSVTEKQQLEETDVGSLWGMEDDDDDDDDDDSSAFWPGAADEAQRLKELRRQQREEQLTTTKTTTKTSSSNKAVSVTSASKSARRQRRRPPEFWNLRLDLLRDYRAEHGHIDVPYRYEIKADGEEQPVRLGQFLHWLRSLFEAETLPEAAPFAFVKELTEMGMKWKFLGKGRRHQLFLQRLNDWRDAVRDNRHNMDPVLRTWMWRQRYQYNRRCENLPNTLTPDRIAALVDANILPYERPSKLMKQSWDSNWNDNFETWCKLNNENRLSAMDGNTLLWTWEQWRMYDILRGDEPYKGDLPVLLNGFRVKNLQQVAFFESERPIIDLLPPDVERTNVSDVDWEVFMCAIRQFFFDKGSYAVTYRCKTAVGNQTLYEVTSRVNREFKLIQRDSTQMKSTMILNDTERIQQLEDLNFFNSVLDDNDPIQDEFEWWERFHMLKNARRDFILGHEQVDILTAWIHEQQMLFKALMNGGENGINEVHYEALCNLGVVFDTPKNEEPPTGAMNLGAVVGRPPSLIKLNDDILQEDAPRKQSDALEDLAWKLRYDELQAFVQRFGHSFVSQSVKPRLALWANNQRLQYKKFVLGEDVPINRERIQLLQNLDFDFGIPGPDLSDEDEWERMMKGLKRFKAAHGNCFVPVALPSNPRLGDWLNQQRQAYRCQELSDEKVGELKKIGVDLDMEDADFFRLAFEAFWTERVDELQQFQVEHGHSDFDDGPLASWAHEQRQFYRLAREHQIKTHLTSERISQLEDANFQWD